MGFKKEVREFMAWAKAEGSVRKQLVKQNQDLMDRFMAREFGEFKTYNPTYPDIEPDKEEYNPAEDETTGGEVI